MNLARIRPCAGWLRSPRSNTAGDVVTNHGITDTDPLTLKIQVEIWRAMSIDEKAAIVNNLNSDIERMAETGVRQRHPNATDREVFLRLAALRLGRDLTVAAYGWDPNEHGW